MRTYWLRMCREINGISCENCMEHVRVKYKVRWAIYVIAVGADNIQL
jgi:hypothetical protein